MLPSSLILCSSSSKISSSDWLMYLVRGGWGNRLCWRDNTCYKKRRKREHKAQVCNIWWFYLLTDLLQDGGLQLHAFEYGAHYYTRFTHLQVTQPPDGHHTACHTHSLVQSASGRTQQQREPVSDCTHDVSHPTSARLCLRGRLSSAWVWWRRCARTDGWSCARRGGISPSSRCMRAAVGQTPAPLSLEQTIASPSARSRLRTWLKARFWTATKQVYVNQI